jgi:hypothetical protein
MEENEAYADAMAGVGKSVGKFFGGIGNYFIKPQGEAPPPVKARFPFAPNVNSPTLGASPADIAAMKTVAAPSTAAPIPKAPIPKAPIPKASASPGAGLGSLAAANEPPADTGTGVTAPAEPSLAGAFGELTKLHGDIPHANLDKYANYLANSDTRAAKQKQEDFWGTIAQIGFGMAGSSSPYALQALGQSASAALPGMMEATKARRAEALQAMKDQAALDLQARDYKQKDIDAAVNLLGNNIQHADKRFEIASLEKRSREQIAAENKRALDQNATDIRRAEIAAKASRDAATIGAGASNRPFTVNAQNQRAYVDESGKINSHYKNLIAVTPDPKAKAKLEADRQAELAQLAANLGFSSPTAGDGGNYGAIPPGAVREKTR